MDAAHRERLERARLKNLAYMQQLDERQAAAEVDALLSAYQSTPDSRPATSETPQQRRKPPSAAAAKNTSVYVTGLSTYIACRQLEGVCAKIGKVRRIKFYKDARGGLKGDATVTFGSHAAMQKAIERLDHFEIKPGVLITAAPAEFKSKDAAESPSTRAQGGAASSQPEPERLFVLEGERRERDGNEQPAPAPSGDPTPSASQTPADPSDATGARLDLPSKSIVLKHAWNPLEPQNAAAFFDELEQDMRAECAKFGAVDHVHIVADGSVLVRFHALEAAIKCLQAMHGRWFDGRQIDARFDQSTPEEPEDADTKLEAFLASIG